jgi:hypothetical protein
LDREWRLDGNGLAGWLVNIECPASGFMGKLEQVRGQGLEVLMYDSIQLDGKVRWQNGVN